MRVKARVVLEDGRSHDVGEVLVEGGETVDTLKQRVSAMLDVSHMGLGQGKVLCNGEVLWEEEQEVLQIGLQEGDLVMLVADKTARLAQDLAELLTGVEAPGAVEAGFAWFFDQGLSRLGEVSEIDWDERLAEALPLTDAERELVLERLASMSRKGKRRSIAVGLLGVLASGARQEGEKKSEQQEGKIEEEGAKKSEQQEDEDPLPEGASGRTLRDEALVEASQFLQMDARDGCGARITLCTTDRALQATWGAKIAASRRRSQSDLANDEWFFPLSDEFEALPHNEPFPFDVELFLPLHEGALAGPGAVLLKRETLQDPWTPVEDARWEEHGVRWATRNFCYCAAARYQAVVTFHTLADHSSRRVRVACRVTSAPLDLHTFFAAPAMAWKILLRSNSQYRVTAKAPSSSLVTANQAQEDFTWDPDELIGWGDVKLELCIEALEINATELEVSFSSCDVQEGLSFAETVKVRWAEASLAVGFANAYNFVLNAKPWTDAVFCAEIKNGSMVPRCSTASRSSSEVLMQDFLARRIVAVETWREKWFGLQPDSWITHHAFATLKLEGDCMLCVERYNFELELTRGRSSDAQLMRQRRGTGDPRGRNVVSDQSQEIQSNVTAKQLVTWLDGPCGKKYEAYDLATANCQHFVGDLLDFLKNPRSVHPAMPKTVAQAVAAATKNGMVIQHFTEPLKSDSDVIRAAVVQDRRAWQYVPATAQAKHNFVYNLVKDDVQSLAFVDLKNDFDFVKDVVSYNGLALEHAPPAIQGNKQIVMCALTENREAIWFVPESLRRDADIRKVVWKASI